MLKDLSINDVALMDMWAGLFTGNLQKQVKRQTLDALAKHKVWRAENFKCAGKK